MKKYNIGEKLEIKIEKIVFGGEGLGRVDGFTIFVPMSVPGDILEIEIISLKKSYGRGLIKQIIKPSKDRIDDINKITFEDFDGCDFGMLKYEKQLEYKNIMLEEVLSKIGGIDLENVKIEKIIGSKKNKNYRNKTAEPIFKKNGKIMTGFYSKKSHETFVAKESLLRSEISEIVINKFLEEVNNFSNTNKEFKVYNEVTKTGFLKHVVVRNNRKNEVMLIIVINKKSQYKELIKVLEKVYNENEAIKSIYVSIKNDENNVILGEKNIHLFGDEYLEEELENIKFKIYPNTFFQVNVNQAEILYEKAIEYLGENKKNTVIDAFSGLGTITMILSQKMNKVIGIESIEEAVNSAKLTSAENGIKNVEFYVGKVEKELPKLLKKEKIEGIIFDPPRKGIDINAVNSAIKNKIKKIVYVSCNPATFSRDAKIFIENGYELKEITPVDMFPQTNHIEIVALLEKK